MNTEEQINHVSQVLSQFYSCPSPANQEAYEKLLTSDIAWQLCPLMLDPVNSHANVQFFGASVLFSRIARLAHTVSLEERLQLRTDLIGYISRYAPDSGTGVLPPKHVYTRLCVALVRLAMVMNSDGQWPNPIEDLCNIIAQCQMLPPRVAHRTVCKLLGLFSEELKTQQQSVITADEEGRSHRLVSSAPFVFQLIEQNLQGTEDELQCLSSWARLGVSLPLFTPKLLDFMFASLKQREDSELSETACDCLLELLTTSVSDQYSNQIWLEQVLPRALQLGSTIRYGASLPVPVDEDFMDYLVRLVKVFVNFVENHANCVTSPSCTVPVRMAVFNLLLECVSFPGQFPSEERISELTLSSWYSIADEFCIDNCEDDGYDEEEDEEGKLEIAAFNDRPVIQSPLIEEIRPYFAQCVRAFVKKCRYPVEAPSAEDAEGFRVYRINVSDIVNFSMCILKHECYNILVDCMQRAVDSQDWLTQEACLYLLGSFIEQEDVEEYVLRWILQVMPTLQFSVDQRFLTTGIIFIGQLAEALNAFPSCLPYAVQFCLEHLADKTMTIHASMSLRSVARENREHLAALAEPVVRACATIIDDDQYDQSDRSRCMAIIGYALSFVSPPSVLLNCFEAVVAPFIRRLLDRLLVDGTDQKALMFDFSLISSFVCSFTTPIEEYNSKLKERLGESCVLLLQGLLPILTSIVRTEQCTPEIFECCMEIFSRFLAFLETRFEQFLLPVAQLVLDRPTTIEKYSLNFIRQCCILFQPINRSETTSSSALLQAAFSDEAARITRHLFVQAVTRSLNVIESDNVDYLVEFVLFVQQIGRIRIHLVEELSDELFQALLEMLARGIQLNEQSTVKCCSDCLNTILKLPRGRQMLSQCGEQLCSILVKCIALQTPTACMEYVLRSLLCLARTEDSLPLTTWMRKALAQDAYFRVTNMEKEKFIMVITRDKLNKQKCLKAASQFAKLARGPWSRGEKAS